jgi:hypothetical protein
MKQILMDTVDKKEWLSHKVISGGVVNQQRAYYAARLSQKMSLSQAIQKSRIEINDIVENKSLLPSAPISKQMREIASQIVF